MKSLKIVLASLVILSALPSAYAGRQQNQRARIHEGVENGSVTKDEQKQLNTEQRAIKKEKKAARADGTVTKDEKKQIHQDEKAASKDIYTDKHNVNPAAPAAAAPAAAAGATAQ